LQLKNNSSSTLDNKNWSLYFNSCRKFDENKLPKGATVKHVNGDLFVLQPTAEFTPLAAGDSVTFDLYGGYWMLNESDAPAGFFFVFDNGKGQTTVEEAGAITILPFTKEKQLNRTATDKVPSENEAVRFEREANATLLAKNAVCPITPTPASYSIGKDSFLVTSTLVIGYEKDFFASAKFLQAQWAKALKAEQNIKETTNETDSKVRFVKDSKLSGEAYELMVNKDKGVTIKAGTDAGAFYGVQSLLALNPYDAYSVKKTEWKITEITVKDQPRFEYRGFHMDVARNFQKKESVLKFLDIAAFYKLNKFHIHLTDDEGWRLEISELPELTQVGSRRGFSTDEKDMILPSFGSGAFADKSAGSGYFTRNDFIEILKFAKERNIEVIPEIDFPGHSRAAIKAMNVRYENLKAKGDLKGAEQYLLRDLNDSSKYESVQMWNDNVICPCQESSYTFIETVFTSIENLYKEAGATLTTIHTGGDEVPAGVWEKSPKCAELIKSHPEYAQIGGISNYFLSRISDITNKKGYVTAGWEEISLMKVKEGDAVHHLPNPNFINKNFRPYVWNNVWGWGQEDYAYQLANAGYKTVLANVTNLYFDLAYYKDPKEPGYYWGGFTDTREVFEFIPLDIYKSAKTDLLGNPLDLSNYDSKVRLTAQGKANVIGMQCHLWSENAKSPEFAEYMLLPRMLAFAERAWSADPAWATTTDAAKREQLCDASWNEFANRLGQIELPRLDYYATGSINYRLPLPGIATVNNAVVANCSYPGLTIRYTTDGSEPNIESDVYKTPLTVEKGSLVKMKTFSTKGRSSRTSAITVK
jgi:hexosaminidase